MEQPDSTKSQSGMQEKLVIPDEAPLLISAAWIESPLDKVGSNVSTLDGCPTGQDSLKKLGCRQQLYTSWDCSSRSYVCCVSVAADLAKTGGRRKKEVFLGEDGDVPTPAEIAAMSAADRLRWKTGKLLFLRGQGVNHHLRRDWMHQEKYKRIYDAWRQERNAQDRREGMGKLEDTEEDEDSNAFGTVEEVTPRTKRETRGGKKQPPPPKRQVETDQQQLQSLESERRKLEEEKKEIRAELNKQKAQYSALSIRYSQMEQQLRDLQTQADTDKQAATQVSVLEAKLAEALREAKESTDAGRRHLEDEERLKTELARVNAELADVRKRAGIHEAPPNAGHMRAYADILPLASVGVTTWSDQKQLTAPVPYTPIFTALKEKIGEPANTALGAMVRGPTVRDASTLLALVRHLQVNVGSIRDEAPLLRAACLNLSLATECYDTEIICNRFIRNWNKKGKAGPIIKVNQQVRDGKIMAISLDTWAAFSTRKIRDIAQGGVFTYESIDTDWVAVPIRSEMIGAPYILEFIMSFCTSSFWNGTVNYFYDGEDATTKREINYTLMPSCNSVYIPGQKNVLLVLLDSTQMWSTTAITIGGAQVPTYQNAPVQPADLSAMWYAHYTTDSIPKIRGNLVAAFNEMAKMLGVENSASIAVTMAAELYMKMYHGLGIKTKDDTPKYDFEQTPYGAYSMDGSNIEGTSIPTENFYPKAGTEGGRQKVIGYNFSGLSSWARPPNGEVRTYQEDFPGNVYRIVVWGTNTPLHHNPTYQVYSANSIVRIAIAVKLLATFENRLYFPTTQGFASWVHMCSVAQACNTAQMFSQTNLSLSLYVGYSATGADIGSVNIMRSAVQMATSNRATWFDFFEYFRQFGEWDIAEITEYYSVDPTDPVEFCTYFPLPVHLIVQWEQKLQREVGEAPTHGSFRHKKIDHRVDYLSPKSLDYRWKAVCSPSFLQVHPMAVYRGMEGDTRHVPAWIDQWSYISLKSSGSTYVQSRDFSSQVFIMPPVDNAICYEQQSTLVVLNSWYANSDENFQKWGASALEYPDPIPWQAILNGAKNWILQPALAGVTGYLTGGIPGAVIGAGGALAGQAVKEFSPPGKESRAMDIMGQTLERARDLLPTLSKTTTPTQTSPEVMQQHTSMTHSGQQDPSQESGLPTTSTVGEAVVPTNVEQAVSSAL